LEYGSPAFCSGSKLVSSYAPINTTNETQRLNQVMEEQLQNWNSTVLHQFTDWEREYRDTTSTMAFLFILEDT